MKLRSIRFAGMCALLCGALTVPVVHADDGWGRRYEVSITNLTRGQQFTPFLVVSHRAQVRLFKAGEPASAELSALAEEGNTAPLQAALSGRHGVGDVATGAGLTGPGETATIVVDARGVNRLSLAAMLIPTNDAFVALDAVELPRGAETLTVDAPAYDAGSEKNDELCTSIPGPFFIECNGSGGGAKVGDGEGHVHIHGGIHGIGNFTAAQRDWRNPVARVTVRRIR